MTDKLVKRRDKTMPNPPAERASPRVDASPADAGVVPTPAAGEARHTEDEEEDEVDQIGVCRLPRGHQWPTVGGELSRLSQDKLSCHRVSCSNNSVGLPGLEPKWLWMYDHATTY